MQHYVVFFEYLDQENKVCSTHHSRGSKHPIKENEIENQIKASLGPGNQLLRIGKIHTFNDLEEVAGFLDKLAEDR